VDHVQRVHGLSQRRACGLIGMDVSSYRYRSRRADDGPLRERLRALAALRRRFGYRRLAWLLDREGTKVNLKKVYRLYREEGLAVKRRRGRRRAIGTRAPIVVSQMMNQRWSLDFVSDQLANGRRFRLLADSDEAAQAFRFDGAQCSNVMSPRSRSLAG
jgi:putative transposase